MAGLYTWERFKIRLWKRGKQRLFRVSDGQQRARRLRMHASHTCSGMIRNVIWAQLLASPDCCCTEDGLHVSLQPTNGHLSPPSIGETPSIYGSPAAVTRLVLSRFPSKTRCIKITGRCAIRGFRGRPGFLDTNDFRRC